MKAVAVLKRNCRSRNGLVSAVESGDLKAGEKFPVVTQDQEVATILIDGDRVEIFLDDIEIEEEISEVSISDIEADLGVAPEPPLDYEIDWNAIIAAFQEEPERCWEALESDPELRDRMMRRIEAQPAPEPQPEPQSESTPEPAPEPQPEPQPEPPVVELIPGFDWEAFKSDTDAIERLRKAFAVDPELYDRCFPAKK